ncbi:hypothetical protein ACIA8C_28610 [Nocardia sp. NPDC051321]|uniref:hypothetical protein n=1 Tax=Nocardia sp. NPDC051321 TaxID=3364323 RepID=UPI0037917DA1
MQNLAELSEFSVVPTYRVRSTTFDVFPAESKDAVARMRRDESFFGAELEPYDVYAGPGLEERVGTVNLRFAVDLDGKRVGEVTSERIRWGSLGHVREFRQDDLGVLTGEQVGLGAVFARRRGMRFIPLADMANDVARVHVRYRGPDSAGFDVVKPMGISKRCHFSVHDPRINRLLLLSCFIRMEMEEGTDVRQSVVEGARDWTPASFRTREDSRYDRIRRRRKSE